MITKRRSAINPILHTPYEEPQSHWILDERGRTTNDKDTGRRPSQSLSGIPGETVSFGGPDTLPHNLINELRRKVTSWRKTGWPGTTSRTRSLLEFWASDSGVAMRPFWCQREAVETAIWLLEAGRVHDPDYHDTVMSEIRKTNGTYNDSIPRLAFKMATGTGKTHLMAMVALWLAANANDNRGVVNFLAIAPNLTVKNRLEALVPGNRDKMWDSITPPGFRRYLSRMRWTVLNFQAFQRRSVLGVNGQEQADSKVKKLLLGGRRVQPPEWTESEQAMLERLLRGHGADSKMVVINDEAHHCYLPSEGRASREEQKDAKYAALWFGALRALRNAGRLERVFDFSATPMWLRRPKELSSEVFPWTVSDFSLLDAIESGLVKIPRVPVSDDVDDCEPRYRNIYEYNGGKDLNSSLSPKVRDSLKQLYLDYSNKVNPRYEAAGIRPVFIVVANKISNAEALYEYIAGTWDGNVGKPGNLGLFSNIDPDGKPKEHPPALLVHSKLDDLTGSEASTIKKHAGLFAAQDATATQRLDAIRNAFATVGRPGESGERIRCIVSVGMLTEGWDARNVTHIFGYRKFGSLLLCEQVTGRALRRTSFSGLDEYQKPEYANVFGVPYTFARGDDGPIQPAVQPWTVESLPGRAAYRIEFPNVVGYRLPSGDVARFEFDASSVKPYEVARSAPSVTEIEGAVGSGAHMVAERRPRTAIWETAAEVTKILSADGGHRRAIFADSVVATKLWLAHPDITCINPEAMQFDDKVPPKIADACRLRTEGQAVPQPVFADMRDRSQPRLLSTGNILFETTLKHRHDAVRSELNVAACHTYSEVRLAEILDKHRLIECWVRNFRLGFYVPWFDAGANTWRNTEPDFIARVSRPGGCSPLHLLIEFKGQERGKPREEQKRFYLEKRWAPAVSAWGKYGEWRVVWIENLDEAAQHIDLACAEAP